MLVKRPILVVSSFRNAGELVYSSALSILSQRYGSFRTIFTDDASTDDSGKQLDLALSANTTTKCSKTIVRSNELARGMTENTHTAIEDYARPGEILVFVDGDDSLIHPDVLGYINAFFNKHDCWVMYGGAHWFPPGSQLFHSDSYSDNELQNLRISSNAHKNELMRRWKIHHIRAFRSELYLELMRRDPNLNCLRDKNGRFFSMAADAAVMRPIIELAGAERIKVNKVKLYQYNLHPNNDHVIDRDLQLECVREIFAKPSHTTLKALPNEFDRGSLCYQSIEGSNQISSIGSMISDQFETTVTVGASPSVPYFKNMAEVSALDCDVQVAASPSAASIDFSILADNELVAYAPRISGSGPSRKLTAVIPPGSQIRFEARSAATDARVQLRNLKISTSNRIKYVPDPLGRAEFELPSRIPSVENCIATVATPNHVQFLETLLESLQTYGEVRSAYWCIFAVEDDGSIAGLARRYQASVIPSKLIFRADASLKSLLYSTASVIHAKRYLCLDADMIVCDSLFPIWILLDSLAAGSMAVVREANSGKYQDLCQAIVEVYQGEKSDLIRLCTSFGTNNIDQYVVNDGLFAGDRQAMLMIDSFLRKSQALQQWVFETPEVTWRNQLAFNLALCCLRNGVIMPDRYNIQLEHHRANLQQTIESGIDNIRPAVLHFNGNSRPFHPAAVGNY